MIKIIAPLYQHDVLSKKLLKDQPMIVNTSLLPLNSFIDTLIKHEDNLYDQHLKEIIKDLDLRVLNDYKDHEIFLKSIKDFHINMLLYHIQVEDLNQDSSKDKDLKLIFSSLSNLVPNEVERYFKLKTYLKDHSITDTYISNYKKNDYDEILVNLLLKHGLQHFEEDIVKTEQVVAYYANNIRSEVEASAQLIVKNKLYQAQVILLDPSYEDTVKQVYRRYNIKNNLSYHDDNNAYKLKLLSVFKLFIKQDKNSVIDFISSNPFNMENMKQVSLLNSFFEFNLETLLSYESTELIDDILSQRDVEYYNKLVLESEETFFELLKILRDLYDENPLRLCENIFNYFQKNHYASDLVSIQNELLSKKDELQHDLLGTITKILKQNSSTLIKSDDVVICNIDQHEYFNKENVIILGSTIKNYPSLTKLSGVIDENYVKHTNYPKKTDRFKKQLEALESIKQGRYVYIFYPLSSLEGKGIEASFSLLNFAQDYGSKPQRYPLIENDAYQTITYELEPHLAKSLFFRGDKLFGSISSFEQYNNASYIYYLKYGLKLYPKSLPNLSYAYLGSVTHQIIEIIVTSQMNGSEYPTDDELIQIINQSFKSLELLNTPQVNVVKLSLIKQLKPVLKHLRAVDEDTQFKPIALEHHFDYNIKDKIFIQGNIDRVDQHEDYVRVIDYKSSKHSLSASKLKQGLQLQLITYLLASVEERKLEPAGAFYISLKTENSSHVAATVKKTKPHYIKTESHDIFESYLNANRLEGWHFVSDENLYNSKLYVKSLREKDDVVSVSSPYNFETVATVLEAVYQNIYDDLMSGNIDYKPVNNSFDSDYQSITLSTSNNNYRPQIYADQNLKKEVEVDVD